MGNKKVMRGDKKAIGNRLKHVRGSMSPEEFGRLTDTFDYIIRDMETGYRLPKIRFLIRLGEELDIDPAYILFGDFPVKRQK